MNWKTTYHTESTDGKTEHITCELWVNFPKSRWNQNEESPVIEIKFRDKKYESGWWLDNEKTKWWVDKPRKYASIKFNYFQRHPEIVLYSDTTKAVPYEEFTLDYCKEYAIKLFSDRLNDVLKQLK